MNLVSHIVAPDTGTNHDDLFWRLLLYFNIYRIILGALFLGSYVILGGKLDFVVVDPAFFVYGSAAYLIVGLAFVMPIAWRKPDFNIQLSLQVCLDIAFVVFLMHASGGIQSGIGLLLLVSIAESGLIRHGRMTLFFAALAAIAVLLEHTYDIVYLDASSTHYVQAGMLSIGYFVIGGLMRVLAQSNRESVELARRREEDLASMEEINHRVIQDLQDGILVLDGEGRIVSWNLQAESLLGAKGDSLQGTFLEKEEPQVARLWQAREAASIDENLLATAKNGRRIRVSFAQVGGGSVVFLEDWDRIQDQARQIKLAALGRLTANVAHEIRNPLSSITYAAELLREDAGGESRLLDIILENARRLDSMVQDILRFNRKDRANAEIFGVGEFFPTFLEQFCKIQKVQSECFSLQLETDKRVLFDKSHLNQVMWNLCRNAWRHSQQKPGSVVIRVDDEGKHIVVDVVDDGPGVPEPLQAQLFEPFFTTSEGGTGLGLYIAREIVQVNDAQLAYVEGSACGHFRIRCRKSDE